MDKATLVTGATGLAGYSIAMSLLQRGRKVRALVRSQEKAKKVLPPGIEIMKGDILDLSSLTPALEGCDVVYHAAGWPEQWLKDPSIFNRVNLYGTLNMIEAAGKADVKKFIYTSTIDAFLGENGKTFDESIVDEYPKGTPYERSKQMAFQEIRNAIASGFPVVSVHPAAIYGPGPTASPGINNFIHDLKKGKVPMLMPGGLPLVFSADVGEGHVLAEEKGDVGESYILSEGYYDLHALAEYIIKILGMNKKPPPVMPIQLVRLVSTLGEWMASLTGKPPLIPAGQLHFLQWGAIPDSSRAKDKLGWKATPLEEGLANTAAYLFR